MKWRVVIVAAAAALLYLFRNRIFPQVASHPLSTPLARTDPLSGSAADIPVAPSAGPVSATPPPPSLAGSDDSLFQNSSTTSGSLNVP